MSQPERDPEAPQEKMAPWRKGVLGFLVIVFLGSLGARAMTSPEPAPQAVGTAMGNTLVPGASGTPAPAPAPEPEGLEAMLPFFTEGSFFGLIGFAVGYASRKIVKLALLMVAVFFVIMQILVYQGMATVDWGALIDGVNHLVFNLQENRTLTQVLTDRVPTAGAFLGGYVLGFRRG